MYCSIDNFRNYANYNGFYAYKYDEEVKENNTKPIVTQSYSRYVNVNTSLNIREYANTNSKIVGSLKNNDIVIVYENIGNWSRIGENRWVCSDYLSTVKKKYTVQNTVNQTRKLKACTLYSNSSLTGIRYNYRANTTVTIMQNVSANIDKVRVNANGRIAYVNISNYANSTSSVTKSSTVNQYRRLKINCNLYKNSNLTGTIYNYLANTQVKIIRNVNSNIDYVYVVRTKRYAYVRNNLYR